MTVTEQHGVWTNNPTAYADQWLRCESDGSSCTPISGATSQSYVPTADDVGSTLEVQETASNAGGASSPAASSATAIVVPPVPVNTGPPSIGGIAQRGQTLTEHHGSWTNQPTGYSYQWLSCDSAGANCTPIAGATSQTYTPIGDDVGHTLAVAEIATNAGGDGAPATSGPTAVVLPAPPVNRTLPGISGTAQQGQTLSVQQGAWTNDPTSYAEQWLRCDSAGKNCAPIDGATGQKYTPVAADIGATIAVAETVSNAGGASAPADSGATAVVKPAPPSNSGLPSIAGTPQQGQTLSEQHGEWNNDPTAYAYQWLRCDANGANCTAIDGATSAQYVPVQDDVGHALEVQETASNSGGNSTPASSAATQAISGAVPQNTMAPSITGTPQQGQTLTEQPGWWNNQPTAFSYQWLGCDATGANCVPIAGATSQTYKPGSADVGGTIEVEETASNPTGDSQPALSAATQPILPAAPVSSSAPTISGIPQQGQALIENHAEWTNEPTSYSYQWSRCDRKGANCSPIDGATSNQYVATQDDVNGTLEVEETASNAGGTSAPAVSAATAVVTAAVPQNTVAPTIAGVPQQGQTLTEQHGTWTNQPTSYSYQWMDCDAAGSNCQAIAGATDTTYVVAASDIGKRLAVQEVATNAAGDGQPAQSDATTTVIPPAPANTKPPTIAGTAHQGGTLTVQQGVWSGEATSYSYQWLRCDSSGANCQPISGASDTTYVPVGADVGDTIEVQETAQGPGGAGNPATSGPTGAVTAAQPPTASLELSQSGGAAPFEMTATIGGVDPEGRAMTYSLDFGDGTTVQTGSLPAGAVSHTYQHAGDYVVRLSVDDGTLTDVKTANVAVALSAPLNANAGDDQVATVNTPVHFDGSASTPTAGIESYHWEFGDGSSADGETADHTYTDPGSYTAKLTVTADGQTSSNTATITVDPKPATAGLQVTITDDSSNPLSGAEVVVVDSSGKRYTATSDGTGVADLQGLADGSYTVYAWKDGYLPATGNAAVNNNTGSTTVALKAGQVATTSLTSTPLTRDQIIAAGIDPNDPNNQNVYQFEIHLAFTPFGDVTIGGYGAGGGGGGGGGGSFPEGITWGGTSIPCSTVCTYTAGGWTADVSLQWFNNKPELLWLIIPGKAKWLKEFFSVQMMVTNLADSSLVLDHGTATLPLPEGLSLAPTPTPQQATIAMPDIPGGQSATATWLVRGDQEGYYPLTASYGGVLEPFGAAINLNAQLQTPLHVWGGSALQMIVDTDDKAFNGYPYRVRIGLKNVADVPVYNPEVDLLENGRVNYIYQPQERLNQGTDEIDPGQTFWTDYYRLVPEISGNLDLQDSFVKKTAGNADVSSTITSHQAITPAQTPRLYETDLKDEVGLEWDPVPGATSYQVFQTSSPDTPFPNAPPAKVEMLPARDGMLRAVVRDLPEGSDEWFTISSTIDGKPTMVHPLVHGSALNSSPTPTVSVTVGDPSNGPHTCGRTSVPIQFHFEDDFFGLTSYTITGVNGTQQVSVSGDASTEDVNETLHLTVGNDTTVTAQAVNADSDTANATGPLWRETFDTTCGVQPAVVLASGLTTSLSGAATATDAPQTSPSPSGPWTGCSNGVQNWVDDNFEHFDRQFATNACDAQAVDNGNLVSFLESQGYHPGTNRSASNRTLLEFSYNGADVNCEAPGGPTFEPRGFTSDDTKSELRHLANPPTQSAPDSSPAAEAYVEALEQYSQCWQEKHGEPLSFTIIGHSEGGYEALAMAHAAQQDGYKGLISSVVSVDGAIQPLSILLQLNAAGCFYNTAASVPEDVLSWLYAPGFTLSRAAANAAYTVTARHFVGNEIKSIEQYGTRVSTVTNTDDPCLYQDATLNPAALSTQWDINYTAGNGGHSAALAAHGNDVNTPGFPLARWLASKNFVGDASVAGAAAASRAAGASRAAASSIATADASATGSLSGTAADAGTLQPLANESVAAVGPGGTTSSTSGQDGTFTIDGLTPGSYALYIDGDGSHDGTWVGGTSEQTATQFTVAAGANSAGTISPVDPIVLSTTITDASGNPVPDAAAALVDANGQQIATGAPGTDGIVRLSAVPGSYTLIAEAPSTVPVKQSIDLTANSGVSLELQPAASVGVTVDDQTGAPIAGAVAAVYSGSTVVDVGVTGSDGTFTSDGIPAGAYTIKLYETLGRFSLPDVALPVTATVGDPASGSADYTVTIVAPVSSTAPTIDGAPNAGTRLAAENGDWTGGPTSYSYQWESCDAGGANCTPISGATAQTYQLTAQDIGDTVRVAVSAANSAGTSDPATSEATAVVLPAIPSNTARPTISGTAEQGQTLTETHGTWTGSPWSYRYQWEDCDSTGGNCQAISGATSQTYQLTANDIGDTIEVQETAINDGGASDRSSSQPTSVVMQAPPANTGPPTITGTVQQGQTLTETQGAWTNDPTSYGYQWEVCDNVGGGCVDIAGATGQSYPLTDNDVGHTLRVQETASNAGGAGSPATSGPTDVVLPLPPASSAAPSITGHAQQGNTLSETHATWSNSPTQFAYQWLRCDSRGASCQPISGATSQTYTPTTDDVGNTLVVQEVASNAGGDGVPAESSPTNVVLPAAPVNSVPPSISGVAEQGLALTEGHGTWSGSPTSYAYQWERCDSAGANCQPISGASAQTYTPVAADVGSTLVVQETAVNAGGVGSQANSQASAVVQPPVGLASVPVATAPPSVSGAARQGETLSESHGTWSPAASSYAYQWEDCDAAGANCVSIAGATGQTYTLTAEDAGYTVRVQEIASNASGSGVPAGSAPTAVVTPLAPSNVAPPAISGSTTEGQTLSESHGSWANSPTSYAYQWEDCDSAGNGCAAVPGATAQNYTLATADVGHTIRVQESASNAGGRADAVTSPATGVVRALTATPLKPSSSSPPVISGTAVVGQTLTTSTGAWSGSPPISYAYQWQVCDPGCRNVVGATTNSFPLTKSHAGERVQVVVTASNSAGTAQAAANQVGPVIPAGPTVAQVRAALTKALSASSQRVKIASLLRSGGYTISFNPPGAGRLVIAWYFVPKGASLPGGKPRSGKKPTAKPVLVAIARLTFHHAGKVKARIALTGQGRQLLKNATHVTLTVQATFVPTRATAMTAQRTFNAG